MVEQALVQGVRFVPETHAYYLGDVQLRSVTTLVKTVVPEFDRDRISRMSAAKKGVSQESLLAEWDRKAQVALEKGTRVHAYIEDVLDGVNDQLLDAVNVRLPEMEAFDAAWLSIQNKLGARVVEKEFMVWDAGLRLAGRVDVILEVGGRRSVFDWKTGKFAISNRWEKLLPPFEDLDHCELNVYSLQTSLYQLLLGRMGLGNLGPAYLVHLSDSGTYHAYRGLDLRGRVEAWALATADRKT